MCPPDICTNSAEVSNSSNSQISQNNSSVFSSQDEELLSILQDLQQNSSSETNSSSKHIGGYFCSDTVLNLSSKVLTDTEINILEKGLDFAPIQNKINQPELRKDFEEFCRRMRIKWYFCNEISENFSEKPAFTPTSKWKPPKGHPSLEVFLNQIEKELFELAESPRNYSNFSKEEWQAMRSLVNDRTVVIKKADKGSCVVVWDREDYIAEAERQLGDVTVYKDVNFREKM